MDRLTISIETKERLHEIVEITSRAATNNPIQKS
jgi:hypothetical protein